MSSQENRGCELVTYRVLGQARWFAEIVGKPAKKCSGKTQAEALGRLLLAKYRLFPLRIRRDESRDICPSSEVN